MEQFISASIAASSSSTEQVRHAQAFFRQFRESSSVLEDCRLVLEQGPSLSQFHAARILGEAAILKWKQLDVTSQRALREYLFQWVCQRARITGDPVARAARTTAAKAFAIVTKRAWLDLSEIDVKTILSQWQELANNSTHQEDTALQVTVGEILISLMHEFSSNKSTGVGLPMGWHHNCRLSFEKRGLPIIVQCSFDRVVGLVGQGSAQRSHAHHQQCIQWLTLVEEIFNWFGGIGVGGKESDGGNNKSRNENESNGNNNGNGNGRDMTQLSSQWHDAFVRSDVVQCLFLARSQAWNEAARASGGDTRILTLLNSVLIHMASINGPVFVGGVAEIRAYAHTLLNGILRSAQEIAATRAANGAANVLTTTASASVSVSASEIVRINMLFVASTIKRLVDNYGPIDMLFSSSSNGGGGGGEDAAVRTLGQLCTAYLEEAICASVEDVETNGVAPDPHDASMEAFERLLETWTSCVRAASGGENNNMQFNNNRQQHVTHAVAHAVATGSECIYQGMVRGRSIVSTSVILAGIDDDDEFEDVTLLDGQMSCAASIGRSRAAFALSLLSGLAQRRSSGLEGVRNGRSATREEIANGGNGNGNGNGNTVDPSTVDVTLQCHVLLDQMWWLLHFAGHLLVDADEGESPMVPDALNAISSSSLNTTTNTATNTTATTTNNNNTNTNNPVLDPVIATSDVFLAILERECGRVETWASSTGGGSGLSSDDPSMSPLLHEKLLWFLRRWCRAYLMPDLSLYVRGLSPSLVSRYGNGTSSGAATAGHILSRATLLLCYWPSEPGVVKAALSLLRTVCSHQGMRAAIVATQSFTSLLRAYSSIVCPSSSVSDPTPMEIWTARGIGQLSDDALGDLSQCICLACDASTTPEALRANLARAAAPAFIRLGEITSGNGNGNNDTGNNGNVKTKEHSSELLRLLRVLRGIAEATSITNLTAIFDLCQPTLNGVVSLVDTHASDVINGGAMVRGCLEYVSHLVERQVVHLDPMRSRTLYLGVHQILSAYMRHGLGASWSGLKRTNSTTSNTDVADVENIAEEIRIVLSIMSSFANKKLTDWYDVVDDLSARAAKEANDALDASILQGLQMIVPNMSPRALAYPDVCKEYFRFVSFACEGYPEKMMNVGGGVPEGLLATVQFGLQHHDTVILRQSLRCVQEMSEHCAKESGLVIARGARTFPQGQTPSPVCSPILQGWLHLLMELILRGNRHIADVLGDAASVLLTLIICEQPTYLRLAQSVVEAHAHVSTKENVSVAFRALVGSNGVRSDKIDRINRRLFHKNLMEFVEIMRALGVK